MCISVYVCVCVGGGGGGGVHNGGQATTAVVPRVLQIRQLLKQVIRVFKLEAGALIDSLMLFSNLA